ncbi:Protein-tyrosine-phosphatase [Asanoa hainanensis]|uniref:Protein-tyrosine-phosphatase n=1 Tax=Asanoa hainanensis TaxID=560556 RepID=A0A239MPB5_9ACTN|nr:ArsR family transcriptional regulator [Asanoa hainanensis]SNT44697.1 Protein-tyrosine-phosphatase [Asanoa hainanensis]
MASTGQAAPPFLRLAAHPLRWCLLSSLAGSDLRVRELAALLDQPQNLVSYHLRLLRDGGLVTANRSSLDGRDSYYHLDLDRCGQALADSGADLHPALRRDIAAVDRPERFPAVAVLFACTGNSARSVIAEALLRHETGGQVRVVSGGSHPKPAVHPDAVRVLREKFDLDIADQRPRHLDTLAGQRQDYVITLCDKVREICPEFPDHPRQIHWSIPDPAAVGGYPAFARTAADIAARVRHLLPVLARPTSAGGPP